MINSKRWLALTVFAAGLLAVSSVRAGVASYAGTACVRSQSRDQPWYAQASADAFQGGNFICPAVQLGGQLNQAVVNVRDVNPSSEVRCSARVRDTRGGGGFTTASVGTGIMPTGYFTLELGGLPAPGFITGGSKFIYCTMGAPVLDSGNLIYSYTIDEL
jgi:hypothetical protein